MREDHDIAEALDAWAKEKGVPPTQYAPCRCGVSDPACAGTYVDPRYFLANCRILFVGLDRGKSWKASAKEVQRDIVEEYARRCRIWNLHYKGCIQVAAEILNLECKSACLERCRGEGYSADCALMNFAQANAVRCVQDTDNGMQCQSRNRIKDCLPMLFAEIGILQPHVIVLQGRNERTGHIQVDFKRELENSGWGHLDGDEVENVQKIIWHRYDSFIGPTLLACLYHPSARGRQNFQKSWNPHFLPAIRRISELLTNK